MLGMAATLLVAEVLIGAGVEVVRVVIVVGLWIT